MNTENLVKREEMSEIGRAYYKASRIARNLTETFQAQIAGLKRDLAYMVERVEMPLNRETATLFPVDAATEAVGQVTSYVSGMNLNYFMKSASDLAQAQAQVSVLTPLVDATEKARIDELLAFYA